MKNWINDFSAHSQADRDTLSNMLKGMKREEAYCAVRNIPFTKKFHRMMIKCTFNRIPLFK